MSESKTSKRRVEAAFKQRRAMELRREGYTFEAIADELGYAGVAGAYKAVMAGLATLRREPAEKLREVQGQRLTQWLKEVREAMQAEPDPEKRCRAVSTLLRIADREAKLFGLDAPTKVAGTKADGSDIDQESERTEVESLIAGLFERRGLAEAEGLATTRGGSDASGLGDNGKPGSVEARDAPDANKRGDNGHPGGSK